MMKAHSLYTICAFLVFAAEEVTAQSPAEQIGKLPVCAQSCITTAFARCRCKILDFSCACNCNSFIPFSNGCTDTSCADSYLKLVLDALDGTCRPFTTSAIAQTPTTSPTSTSPSAVLSSPLTKSIQTSPTTSTEAPTGVFAPSASSGIIDPSYPGPTGGPAETGAGGNPSANPGNPSVLSPTIMGSETGPGPFPIPTTASYSTYSYCYPGSNGTTAGWNASVSCTVGYNGPLYTGNEAVRRVEGQSSIISMVIFIVGLFIL
ncbi:uncharacterized protein BDR25DRAFT_344680 [Lindgomyces ingoldianus]|uniref:Uncharacterized protein n=1 Tax=Lindgomyces ingoldianus TaxID=673940 RepID=A0ACB6QMZ8_9PLEO|nr:uncharacterized protein BDR25DRAFT_344680 [Lindgomyces ingoldianus]KAF2467963.1 hypothetical protein BDR25DRAFT_344680 [Lindgomyces ingoldianus]